MKYKKYFDLLEKYNQEHILIFWDQYNDSQKSNFIKQIESIDFDLLNGLYKKNRAKDNSAHYISLEPTTVISLSDRKSQDAKMIEKGEELLKAGKVAVFLVAGGQGSR